MSLLLPADAVPVAEAGGRLRTLLVSRVRPQAVEAIAAAACG